MSEQIIMKAVMLGRFVTVLIMFNIIDRIVCTCRDVKAENCCPSKNCPSQLPCAILYNQLGPFDECILREAEISKRKPAEVGAAWESVCVREGLCKQTVGACRFINQRIVHDICFKIHRIRVLGWQAAAKCP